MRKIMVHSYKGGTGKSLISTNLAQTLVSLGKSVLVIEFDYNGAELIYDKILGKFITESFEHGFILDYIVEDDPSTISQYINRHQDNDKNYFDIIFSKPISDFSEFLLQNDITLRDEDDWWIQILRKLISGLASIEDKYDTIIFDIGPGISRLAAGIAYIVNDVILISRATIGSIESTKDFIKNYYNHSDSKMSHIIKMKNFYLFVNQLPTEDILRQEDFSEIEELNQYKREFIDVKTRARSLNQSRYGINGFHLIEFDFLALIHSSIYDIILPTKSKLRECLKQFAKNTIL